MTSLLQFSSDEKSNPVFVTTTSPDTMYQVSLQISPFPEIVEGQKEKAALLGFRFLDESGREILHPELPLSGLGFNYRYLRYNLGENLLVDFKTPNNAVKVELSIHPWMLKSFSAKILKFSNKETTNARNTPTGTLLWKINGSVNKTFRNLTEDQAQLRLFLETMIMEERREKTDYSQIVTKLPSIEGMETAAKYNLARDYLAMRRQKRKDGPRHLIISNGYPNSENLYVNGFLHARIKQYQAAGVDVDVVAYARGMKSEIWRYDGVDVIGGYVDQLAPVLALEDYESVSVHFLHPHMWSVMKNFSNKHKFHIVIHGYEIRNWIRSFNPASGYETAKQDISRSQISRDFWEHVINGDNIPDSFIFVSQWMKNIAEEDVMQIFPQNRSHVIHNFINPENFPYVEKSGKDARKILIIRNFDKYVYATDLALNCLKELRKRPIWKSLEISVFGQGEGLSDFEKEFASCDNVAISPGYLTTQEMQSAYANHGIMLIPSRLDSQGVSRGEAMAAGLVPATSAVCAVPEFVDKSCAILAESEDFLSLADGIEELAKDSNKFKSMSRAAADRVRQQCSFEETIKREMQVLGLSNR